MVKWKIVVMKRLHRGCDESAGPRLKLVPYSVFCFIFKEYETF